MYCPFCDESSSKVIDSRDSGDGIRRRRECLACARRFTTYERVQMRALMVVKRDERREEFIRDKLWASVTKACAKRPLPLGSIEKALEEIESDLSDSGRAEITSKDIGELVMDRLKVMDRVAYIRYASVYRDFDSLDGFVKEIQEYETSDDAAKSDTDDSQLELIPNEYAIPPKPKAKRGRRPGITEPSNAAFRPA